MRILLVNHYAGSPAHGMEFRPYYLAREWVRAGHEVLIVAASYSHVRAVQPEMRGLAREELIDGIRYRWLPTPHYGGNGVGRLRNILSFLRQLRGDAWRLTREFRPDAVIASSTYPMDVWVARKLARLARARLVYEVHDLWPLSLIELSGMSPHHPFAMLCGKAESDAYRDADRVVSMLPCVHDHMASRGLDLAKLHIVPNGFAPEEWQGHSAPLAAELAAHLAAERAAGRVVVGYAGSMGLPNALDVLLDAAAFVPTNRLDLQLHSPDFVVMSFYKMFGYPTGVGCLLVRNEALPTLRRPWFGGGTVNFATVQGRMHVLSEGEAGFEDGTLNYLSIPAVETGLRHLQRVGIETIGEDESDAMAALKQLIADKFGEGE